MSMLKGGPLLSRWKRFVETPLFVYLFLFLLSFILRFPYFFPSVMDWDESTYIIMGQDILDGHLPYSHLLEMKPPLLFLFYALFIALFGKTILAVRLGGLLCVYFSGCILYRIGRFLYAGFTGFWAAILLIIYSTTFINGRGTMSEHIVLLPVSLLLYMLITKIHTDKNIFIAGLLIGGAILIRTNMIYLGLGLGVFLLLNGFKRGIIHSILKISILLAGILLPLLMVIFLYFITDNLDIFIKLNFLAPIAYISQGGGFLESMRNVVFVIGHKILSHNFLIWFLFIHGIIIIYIHSRFSRKIKILTLLILLLFLSVLYSIIETKRTYSHYFIQLLPFMALIASVSFSHLIDWRDRLIVYIFLITGMIFVLKKPLWDFFYIGKKILNKENILSDAGYQIADYLNKHNCLDKYVFFCTYHIGYWLTGAKLPTRYVHPSSLGKEYFLKAVEGGSISSKKALERILLKEPLFIVKPEKVWYFNRECNAILNEEVKSNYRLEKIIGKIYIYRRK